MKLPTVLALAALLASSASALPSPPSQLVLDASVANSEAVQQLHAAPEAWLPPAEAVPDQEVKLSLTGLKPLSAEEYAAYEVPSSEPHVAQPGSGWVWQSCGLDADVVRVDRVDVDPDPPRSGQNMTVKAAGEVKAEVDEGSVVDVVVKLGLIRLLSKRFDLCEVARENDAQLQCPLKPGYYEIEHTVELPRGIPPAKFNVHLTGLSHTDLDLLCLDLSIDFGRH